MPMNSPTLFQTAPTPTPYGLLFPKTGGSQPQKFSRYYFGNPYLAGAFSLVHPNKSPFKVLEKRERGRIQGLPKFFWIPPIISRTGKATNFKFCTHIHRIDRNKSPLKISAKVAVGVLRDSQIFQGTMYRARPVN